MSTSTTTQRDAMLNAVTTYYIDLYNGDPSGVGTSQLLTLTGSATRPSATLGSPATDGAYRKRSNASEVIITASAAGAATVDYWAMFDAATGGNLVQYGQYSPSKSFTAGDEIKVNAGEAYVQLTDE